MTARRECLIRASGTRRCTPTEFLLPLPLFSRTFAFFLLRRCARKAGERKESKKARPDGGADGRREDDAQWAFFWKIKVQRRHRDAELCVGQRLALKLKSRAKTYGESKVRERWMGGLTRRAREVRGVGL